MGKEKYNQRNFVQNRNVETAKMHLRKLYGAAIWYEFMFWPKELKMPRDVLGEA